LRQAIVSSESNDGHFFMHRSESHRVVAHKVASVDSAFSVDACEPLFPSRKESSRLNAQFRNLFCIAKKIASQRDDTMAACDPQMSGV
jgi:hypothetical protein